MEVSLLCLVRPESVMNLCHGGGGWTAGGHLEAVRLLCNSGARLGARDDKGATPMLMASQAGKMDVIRILHKCADSPGKAEEKKRRLSSSRQGSPALSKYASSSSLASPGKVKTSDTPPSAEWKPVKSAVRRLSHQPQPVLGLTPSPSSASMPRASHRRTVGPSISSGAASPGGARPPPAATPMMQATADAVAESLEREHAGVRATSTNSSQSTHIRQFAEASAAAADGAEGTACAESSPSANKGSPPDRAASADAGLIGNRHTEGAEGARHELSRLPEASPTPLPVTPRQVTPLPVTPLVTPLSAADSAGGAGSGSLWSHSGGIGRGSKVRLWEEEERRGSLGAGEASVRMPPPELSASASVSSSGTSERPHSVPPIAHQVRSIESLRRMSDLEEPNSPLSVASSNTGEDRAGGNEGEGGHRRWQSWEGGTPQSARERGNAADALRAAEEGPGAEPGRGQELPGNMWNNPLYSKPRGSSSSAPKIDAMSPLVVAALSPRRDEANASWRVGAMPKDGKETDGAQLAQLKLEEKEATKVAEEQEEEEDFNIAERAPTTPTSIWPSGFQLSWDDVLRGTDNLADDNLISSGPCGRVYRGDLPGFGMVAVRVIPEGTLKRFPTGSLHQLRMQLCCYYHPNVVQVLGSVEYMGAKDTSGKRQTGGCLITEYVPGGTLQERICATGSKAMSWNHRLMLAMDLASAVAYLQAEKGGPLQSVHGRIKPANVLIDALGRAKLADFGLARLRTATAGRVLGVPHNDSTPRQSAVHQTGGVQGRHADLEALSYLPPEVLMGETIGMKADTYSFGLLCAVLLTGCSVLEAHSKVNRWCDSGDAEDIADPNAGAWPPECVHSLLALITACIREDAAQRLSMQEARIQLEKVMSIFVGLDFWITYSSISPRMACCGTQSEIMHQTVSFVCGDGNDPRDQNSNAQQCAIA
ncbi:hypothetical protein CYMTET_44840 [Cymbomonas tetramitiformis]|uniref:Protein kinase domain-containing protein n=1 Tax=Cymbomonas tetramitiformis TaxID=36881 RepID=A0AAE0C0M6_9CHLO|nr:hypothetical protein CYMTET_44840 [Cymbomonas tetramitiformis]